VQRGGQGGRVVSMCYHFFLFCFSGAPQRKGWQCKRSCVLIFFVITTPFNAKRTTTTTTCYFSAMSLFFVLLQHNSMVKRTTTWNFPHHYFFYFVAMQLIVATSIESWSYAFALVLFLVFVVAQLWWSFFLFSTTWSPCFASILFLFLVDGNSKEKKDWCLQSTSTSWCLKCGYIGFKWECGGANAS